MGISHSCQTVKLMINEEVGDTADGLWARGYHRCLDIAQALTYDCLVCYLLGDSSPTSHFFTQISKEFEMISQISHYPLEKNQPASIISYPQIPRTLFLLSNLSPFCNMSVPFYYILKWQLISAATSYGFISTSFLFT